MTRPIDIAARIKRTPSGLARLGDLALHVFVWIGTFGAIIALSLGLQLWLIVAYFDALTLDLTLNEIEVIELMKAGFDTVPLQYLLISPVLASALTAASVAYCHKLSRDRSREA